MAVAGCKLAIIVEVFYKNEEVVVLIRDSTIRRTQCAILPIFKEKGTS